MAPARLKFRLAKTNSVQSKTLKKNLPADFSSLTPQEPFGRGRVSTRVHARLVEKEAAGVALTEDGLSLPVLFEV